MIGRLKLALIPPLGAGVIRLLGMSVRTGIRGMGPVDALHRQGTPIIFAFWHSRQLMMPLAYRGKSAHVLISQHRDGELIHRIVARFGLHPIRGSTTRGGRAAFRRLIELGRAGQDLVITPDGPKGPRQVAKEGIVRLAKVTGLPIVPVTFSCSKKKSLGVGTDFSFRIPSAAGYISAERRSGCRPTRPTRNWKRSGWSWKNLSTGSRPREMRRFFVLRSSRKIRNKRFDQPHCFSITNND
ncbi:MAG: lysophospholipid acyltransferase family protein [Nitrospiraceae bacterium]|nr:lysophospholipid acyltransferase family protein [Nitrospiraceae bacterium]